MSRWLLTLAMSTLTFWGAFYLGRLRSRVETDRWRALYLRQEGQCEQAFTHFRECAAALGACEGMRSPK